MSRPAPTLGRTGLRRDDLDRVRLRLRAEYLPGDAYRGLHRELAASILLRALDDLAEPRHARLAGRQSRLHAAAVGAVAFLVHTFPGSPWAEWLPEIPADRLRALVAAEAAETAAQVPALAPRLASVLGPPHGAPSPAPSPSPPPAPDRRAFPPEWDGASKAGWKRLTEGIEHDGLELLPSLVVDHGVTPPHPTPE